MSIPVLALRVTGVCVSLLVTLPPLWGRFAGNMAELQKDFSLTAHQAAVVQRVGLAAGLTLIALFALFFWISTRPRQLLEPARWVPLVLLLETALAYVLNIELLYLVAAQAGFMLAPKTSYRFAAGLLALVIGIGVQAARDGSFVAMEGVAHLPALWQQVFTIGGVLAYMAFAFAAGQLIAIEARQRRDLALQNAELQATRQLLSDSSRIAERVAISRELHDTVGHHLTALSVNLQLATRRATGDLQPLVREAHLVAKLLLAEVREVVGSLRKERSMDIAEAMRGLGQAVREPEVHIAVEELVAVHEPALAHVLYRCAQEAVTNAVRHARAAHVWVRVFPDRDGVSLEVKDDGRGAASVQPGNGLRGMRERVEEWGGQMQVHPRKGQGFLVNVWLPAGSARV